MSKNKSRNDFCPCGSGSSYQDCCLHDTLTVISEAVQSDASQECPSSLGSVLAQPIQTDSRDTLKITDFYRLSDSEFLNCVLMGGIGFSAEEMRGAFSGEMFNEEGQGIVCSVKDKNETYFNPDRSQFLIELNNDIKVIDDGSSELALYYFYTLINSSQSQLMRGCSQNVINLRTVLDSKYKPDNKEKIQLKSIHLVSDMWFPQKSGKSSSYYRTERQTIRPYYEKPDCQFDFNGVGDILTGELCELDLFNRLQFEFTNGCRCSLSEVFENNYCYLLPDELIPKHNDSIEYRGRKNFDWSEHCARPERLEISSDRKLNIFSFFLDKTFKIFKKGQVSLFVGSRDATTKSIEIKSMAESPSEIEWTMRMSNDDKSIYVYGDMISNKLNSGASQKSNWYLDKKNGTLSYSDSREEALLVKRICKDISSDYTGYYSYTQMPYQFNLGRVLSLAVIKKKFQEHKIKLNSEIIEVYKKNDDYLIANFETNNANTATVSVNYKDNDLSLTLSHRFQWLNFIFNGLSSGMAGAFEDEARVLSTKDSFKRGNELKLYKHSGLFLLILLEALKFYRQNQEKPKKLNTYINVILPKVKDYCLDLLSKKEDMKFEDISLLVSKKFISNIKKAIRFIASEESLEHAHFRSGTYCNLSFKDSMLRIAEVLSDAIFSEYGQKAFTRSKFNNISISWETSSVTVEDIDSDSSDESALFRIYSEKPLNLKSFIEKMDCRIDGLSIEEVFDKDIMTHFYVDEKKGKRNWFDLSPEVFFKGEAVAKASVDRFLKDPVVFYKGKYYFIPKNQIPALKWLDYFWTRLYSRKLDSKYFLEKESEKNSIGDAKSEVLNMLALRASGVSVLGGERWKKICKQFDLLSDDNRVEQSNGKPEAAIKVFSKDLEHFTGELKDFQEKGVSWLQQIYTLGLGGVLSDEMGLGKTVQSLAFLEILRNKGQMGHCLIVVPTSLVYNWKTELKRFCPKMKMSIFQAKEKMILEKNLNSVKEQVVICTYGLLMEHSEYFENIDWNIILFDEAQSIKNIKAKRRKSAYSLNANSKFCLTGTPMENHYGEFFSIVDLVVPGALGNYSDFMKVYKLRGEDSVQVKDVEFLKKKVKPLILRRMKADVLKELPDKVETVIPLVFDIKQEKIYKDIAISWNSKIRNLIEENGESKSQLEMLTALLRLRQVCSCPSVIPNIKYDLASPKEELLIENIKELNENSESVIVFTNFISSLNHLKERFKAEGLRHLSICGADSIKKREKTLKEFSESELPYTLIMTLKTGGVGLNLTKANYVIHFEPWWNPAAENQGTDRVHRMGQKRSVQVYRYIMQDSVEEKIQSLKKIKSNAFDALFSETEAEMGACVKLNTSSLTQKDFELLLT